MTDNRPLDFADIAPAIAAYDQAVRANDRPGDQWDPVRNVALDNTGEAFSELLDTAADTLNVTVDDLSPRIELALLDAFRGYQKALRAEVDSRPVAVAS